MKLTLIRTDRETGKESFSILETDALMEKIKKENKAAVQVTIINYHTIDLIFKLLLEHESKSGLYLFVLVDFARSIIRLIQQPFR